MNLSQKVALILGPSLAIIFLFAGYWVKTHQLEAGMPLELHAGVPKAESAAIPPPSSPVMDVPAPPPIEPPQAPKALPVAAPPAAAPPKFDVVRVEPTGELVIAGHTEPDSQVAVIANGQVIAEGKSDAAGQFVLLPPPLTAGDHALALQVTPPSGHAVTSDQNVVVSVPVKGKGDVMVALAEPGKPTVLLTDPTAKPEAPKSDITPSAKAKEEPQTAAPLSPTPPSNTRPAKPEVSIKTVEIVEPGGFFATGFAAPNARLRLYLNGSALIDVTAGRDGQWAIKIGKGLVPGHYAVRIDQLDASSKVVARAEVPFDYTASKQAEAAVTAPLRQSERPSSSSATTATVEPGAPSSNLTTDPKPANLAKAAESATAVVGEIQTATVEKGNSLWRISRGTLGRGIRYTEIYAANAAQIRDPKLIYPGQVFVIPGQIN